jgi:predicted GH43/DUF377 family glycosyl hydrolase
VTTTTAVDVHRQEIRLRPDPRRVVARLFVPGQEGLVAGESRAGSVIDRVLALDDDQVTTTLEQVRSLFTGRYRDLGAVLDRHYELVAHRVTGPLALSEERRLLVGAYFTQEYAVEAAAVCNPSMVPHPDQSGTLPGQLRFVMSVRAIGEGHRSAIEFRTGTVDAEGTVAIDEPGVHLSTGRPGPVRYGRDLFHRLLRANDDDGSSAAFVLEQLPDPFDADQLAAAVRALRQQLVTRRSAIKTIERMEAIAASTYQVVFPDHSALSERVMLPVAPTESHGMEDARFVRFTGADGAVEYHATYTAYDGEQITVQRLSTTDFVTFTSTPLSGRAAVDKGMALFPRPINGHYAALSRWDRTTNSVVLSDDPLVWEDPISLQSPAEPWDTVQLGNCGSPLETPAGWIVLTHGVGPMRRYVIGAELLDLDEPARVIGHLRQPLIVPLPAERDGYVPNVVYSCGAMLHGGRLVVPYGMSDANVGVATVSVDQLLEALTAGP